MNHCSSIRRQNGVSLIEAIISLLLVGLLSQGAVNLTTRATAAHTEQQLLDLTVNQMRSSLISNMDICTTNPIIQLPNNQSVTTSVQGCGSTMTVTIDTVQVNNIPRPITLSINLPEFGAQVVDDVLVGGQVVVGGTWESQ